VTLPLFPSPPTRERPVHTCHARDCGKAVPPEMLMCRSHWRQVPRAIQLAVWRAYRPGQCDDKIVNRQWLRAADAAIGFVARAEGRPVRSVEAAALETFQ